MVPASQCEKVSGIMNLPCSMLSIAQNCGDVAEGWSSPRVIGEQKVKPLVVNILPMRAMQSTGNRQTAVNDTFAAMNVSHRSRHAQQNMGVESKNEARTRGDRAAE